MSFDNGELFKVSMANALTFRTRSQERQQCAVVRTVVDVTPPAERWVRREGDDTGFWIEQINPQCRSTFGDAKWISYKSVEV